MEELDIPVFHDDQHGTAIVTVAAAINAAKLVKKRLRNLRVVGVGVGAAGLACAKLLMAAGVRHYVGFNVGGAIHKGRTDLTEQERWLAENSNHDNFDGTIQEALEDADMFLGLAGAGIIQPKDLAAMRRDPIVFALANPTPEVPPLEAKKFARVVATGGSDYPNQINNALVFPGFFRGLLESRTQRVTEEMKIAAARALAAVVSKDELDEDHVIPSIFDDRVAKAVADAVIKEAQKSGLCRHTPAKKLR
jgi:malate dehydrogenase (oxaloacetate-decarboxylating)